MPTILKVSHAVRSVAGRLRPILRGIGGGIVQMRVGKKPIAKRDQHANRYADFVVEIPKLEYRLGSII
jgi:hypothetical protein